MPDAKFDDAVMKLAQFGELEELKKRATAGALRVDEQDDRGFTVVAWSARNGHMEVLDFLIAENHSIEIASFGGLTPLHHACNKNLERVVRRLIKAGADVNKHDENGDKPLHYASARGVLNLVTAILEAGANPSFANEQGVTALHKGALFGHLSIVKKLAGLEKVDVNAKDVSGDTALHMAARCNFPLVVKCLLESADKSAKNKEGKTPREVASTEEVRNLFA